jgi:hypothetical protein
MIKYSKIGEDVGAWTLKFKWMAKNENRLHAGGSSGADAARACSSDPEPSSRVGSDEELTDAAAMAEHQDTVSELRTTRNPEGEEAQSYGPVVEFLRGIKLVAYQVANGENLPDGYLFDEAVYTIRQKDPWTKGQPVRYIRHLRGRTDIVVLSEDFPRRDRSEYILRSHVKILIEIKTPKTISPTGSLHEAMMQLIGANVQNGLRSPPVVVSNLTKTHYVLYLTREASDTRPHYYLIHQMYCASFGAAIHFALTIADEAISEHFARGMSREPTPDNSPLDSPPQ